MTEQNGQATEEPTQASGIDPQELKAAERAALELITEICTVSGMDVRPVVRGLHPPYMEVELAGGDAAQTFGRYGPSLDALQFLANLILSHRTRSEVRLILDADDYRARRADTLRGRALDLAREVKARQEEAELEPLSAAERRIIHTALADDPDIMTYSEGDEPDRRIVISPKR